jgi:hypothetical protein
LLTRPDWRDGGKLAWKSSADLADWQNVADVCLPKSPSENEKVRILTEPVRDAVSGTKKHLLEPRSVLFEHGEASDCAQIAFTLLADALGDEAHATEIHEYFGRRVVTLFPERRTISRSRVLAHVMSP